MIIPAGYRVLVKPDEVEEFSAGGIALPTDKREEAGIRTGTLVRVGVTAWKGFDQGEPWAKVGDKVTFARYAGDVHTDPEDGEKYRVMNDEDISSIIKESNNG